MKCKTEGEECDHTRWKVEFWRHLWTCCAFSHWNQEYKPYELICQKI